MQSVAFNLSADFGYARGCIRRCRMRTICLRTATPASSRLSRGVVRATSTPSRSPRTFQGECDDEIRWNQGDADGWRGRAEPVDRWPGPCPERRSGTGLDGRGRHRHRPAQGPGSGRGALRPDGLQRSVPGRPGYSGVRTAVGLRAGLPGAEPVAEQSRLRHARHHLGLGRRHGRTTRLGVPGRGVDLQVARLLCRTLRPGAGRGGQGAAVDPLWSRRPDRGGQSGSEPRSTRPVRRRGARRGRGLRLPRGRGRTPYRIRTAARKGALRGDARA